MAQIWAHPEDIESDKDLFAISRETLETIIEDAWRGVDLIEADLRQDNTVRVQAVEPPF